MAQIKYYDKRVGITYVYESESYYDSQKHQSRSRRKLIGKIDPDTGEMIPCGKKGRPSKNITIPEENDYKRQAELLQKQLAKSEEKAASLAEQLNRVNNELDEYKRLVQKINALCGMVK